MSVRMISLSQLRMGFQPARTTACRMEVMVVAKLKLAEFRKLSSR